MNVVTVGMHQNRYSALQLHNGVPLRAWTMAEPTGRVPGGYVWSCRSRGDGYRRRLEARLGILSIQELQWQHLMLPVRINQRILEDSA